MKRLLPVILVCLLLCGCGGEAAETTAAAEIQPTVTPAETADSLISGSEAELAADGAVRQYSLAEPAWAIRSVGEDLLIFSGYDTTTITRVTGENFSRVAEIGLEIFVSPDYPSTHTSENAVVYYDYWTGEMVFLNRELQEINRMALPEDIMGEAVFTADRRFMYYCTASGVRCLDMETEISRLVKEMTFAEQYLTDLMMNDSVLLVETWDAENHHEALFLDAHTGQLLGGTGDLFDISASAEYFYAMDAEGIVTQMIFTDGEETWLLTPENYLDVGYFLPRAHGAVVYTQEGKLDYYDLASGRRTASVELAGSELYGFQADGRGNVYFLDLEGNVYRWDCSATPTGDETVYTGPRTGLEDLDSSSLQVCKTYADTLGQRYGVDIRVGMEAVEVEPYDYHLVPEYQENVIFDGLVLLEKNLMNYPEGFFEAAMEDFAGGEVVICLVRSLIGNPEFGSLDTSDGIQFWDNNNAYIALAFGEPFERILYHEMYHVLESRVLCESTAYYRWDELNPKGFDYDYDYIANQDRMDYQYLEAETRSFIDMYSMSYPKEDRARIMEYACMEGNEHYFISYTMQQKLRTLCVGIREAYDLTDYPQPLLWEQYLEAPLTP